MKFIVFLILIVLGVYLVIYFLQQFLNKFNVSIGKVPVTRVYTDGSSEQLVLNTINKVDFNIYFGLQGSGKTTYLAYIVSEIQKINKRRIKKGLDPLNIYSNITLFNCDYIRISKSDIGTKYLHDGVLLFDESGIDFNNRKYKSLSFQAIEFLKKHRHYNLSICMFSQSYEDSDVTLRRLASNYFHVTKSIFYFINHHVCIRGISKFLFIEKEKNEILEGYKYKFLSRYRINAKKYFKYFSSFERDLELVGE